MHFDWNDLRFFLELVRTGSPSSAGRRLKADHTTVRRRVDSLEDALCARLFAVRGPTYQLTAEGDRLLKYAEEIETLANRLQSEIANSDLAVSGTVRVGAPDGFGAFYLAPRMAKLSLEHPELQMQLIVLPRVINLSNREADIAIALSPPSQQRQIVRKLTKYRLGIYASAIYLRGRPPIVSAADLATHTFIGYVPELLHTPELDLLPQLGATQGATFELTSIVAQVQAAIAGAGLCVLPSFIASAEPRLQAVLPHVLNLEREFWLVIHPEVVNLARVRAVIDFIAEQVRRDRDLMLGDGHESAQVDAPLSPRSGQTSE
jgi:DNA-binding transcriptional LysR family regulator